MAAEIASFSGSDAAGLGAGELERVGDVVVFGFRVLGSPVGKDRPRFRRRGDYVQTYTPKKTADWEQEIGEQVGLILARFRSGGHLAGIELPLAGRIMVSMRFNIAKPASAPKRERHRLKKPDLDNLEKCVLDALQTIQFIGDDKTVTDMSSCKRYATDDHPEGVEIEVTAWLS